MTDARIERIKQAAEQANDELNDAHLARTIAAGHNGETHQRATEIKAAISKVIASERQRKAAWRTLEELLNSHPAAATQCQDELAGLRAELAVIGG